ncbi:Proline-serine-threonine phosphatase-interacting protein 2 [Podila clonocystis]|nr:Proline-serine-threonine phosphatase-interacting protein 2 [Podila clonocystis]
MRHAKLTCQEILGMAALEEEYGKKLLKLSKSPLGKDELGSLRDSLDVVRYEIEATGKSHIELANKMRDQLENALAEFNNGQKDKRKLHQVSIDRTFRNKQLYLQQLVKAKEKYDAECIRTKGLSAAKMNLVGKELDKVSLKMEKTELASRAADVEYQASIRQLTEINDKWIVEWRTACDKFQLLEEQRIDYVRTCLWNYANIISSTCVADDESCERIRSSLEVCDVNQNLQSFIEASATGDETPDIPTYLSTQLKIIPGDTPADNPLLAKAQAQDMKIRTVSGPHQPLPEQDPPAPPSRRQSNYSSNEGPDGEALPPPIDMALSIGGNVFKLDTHTVNILSQPDEKRGPIGGYPPPNPANHAPQNISPGTAKPVVENSLGISLDVTGTVKEDRFPHWQSQAQQSQQAQQAHNAYSAAGPSHSGHLYHQHPSGEGHAQSSRMMSQAPVTHSRSQTMPIQNDPSRGFVSNPDAMHRRSMSGAQADQSLAYQYQHQQPYQAEGMVAAMPVASGHPGQNVGMKQTSMDGKPILFYVRAIYDYEATIPEELNLKEGDILAVLHTRDDGWWEGDLLDEYHGARRGLFPSNFTEPTA